MAAWTMTFIVRLTCGELGCVTGVVEQVKTGLKVRVAGLDTVGEVIGRMIARPENGDVHDSEGESPL